MTTQSLNLATPKPLEVEEIAPTDMRQFASGHWFFDFGRAAFGAVRLTVSASNATRATLHLGETLEADGAIDRKPAGCVRYRSIDLELRAGNQTIEAQIPPDDRNTGASAIRMPRALFEVVPFRYCELEVADDIELTSIEITQLAVHYPFDESAASFACDDDGLNRVWDLCKYSIKATTFCGVYVDGDRERIPYEGDAYINQLCHYGVDAEYELARHTLEHLLFHPTWPTEWVLHCVPMAWADYQYTGKLDLLAGYYEVLQARALLPLAREDGLISTETGLVTQELQDSIFQDNPLADLIDWPPGSFTEGGTGERDNYDMVPVKTAVNAFHAWNLELLARIADALGKAEDAAFYRERFRRVTESIRRVFFREDKGIFVDGEGSDHSSLHANMFPAAFGLTPDGREGDVMKFIRSRGMACSVYGAQYLLEACFRLGDSNHALDLMTADHDRSWINMLNVGSTMTLEAWDQRYKNNLDWNHAWGAAPANIIPRFLAGVRPAKPGFEEICIAPRPGRIRWLNAIVPTPQGPVHVGIEPDGDSGIKLQIETPAPTRLDLTGLSGTLSTHGPDGFSPLMKPGRHTIQLVRT